MVQACSFLNLDQSPAMAIAAAMLGCGWLVCWILVYLLRRYAPALGLVDQPGTRKIHSHAMPRGGGIGIVLSLVVAFLLGWYLLGWLHSLAPGTSILPDSLALGKEMWVILAGAVVIGILGLVDDLRNLQPMPKLIVESLVAWMLIYHNIRITLFIPSDWFSFFATWGWILLITNAFNLLDNMDGLSAGVAFISGGIFLVVAVQTAQWNIALFLAALLGSLLGFLCFNFPPASIFMGDCGSLFIGYLMAVLTIQSTFYQGNGVVSVALPLLVMAVPLFDTSTVAWLRWREKRPIFQGDKKHFSHRLVGLGMSNRQAVLTIYLVTFSTGLSALLLYQLPLWGEVLVVVQIVAVLAVIHMLQQIAARHARAHDQDEEKV